MNRIRELRTARGWTQTQLGKRIGAAKSTISEYESEKHQLDPGLICSFCDLFGCTADYLLGRSESPSPVISEADARLLDAYHALPLAIRQAVDGLIAPYRRGAEEKMPAESMIYATGYKKVSEPDTLGG